MSLQRVELHQGVGVWTVLGGLAGIFRSGGSIVDFERFTKWGALSNWGWYSGPERALLAKELEVSKAFTKSEGFIKKEESVLKLFVKFMAIRLNTSVTAAEMGTIDQDLDAILADLKEERLKTLDKLGPNAPSAPAPFSNHQKDALVGEIRSYLATRKKQEYDPDPLKSGFVIHLNLNLPAPPTLDQFQLVVKSGAKVLWTYDVDGILSIGDPRSTKHSIVAVGKDVKAAGIAQKKIDQNEDAFHTLEQYKRDVESLNEQLRIKFDSDVQANKEYKEQEIKILQESLGSWTPKPESNAPVILDFDSGHYTPSGAWGDAVKAWNKAGFQVEWSRDARHV